MLSLNGSCYLSKSQATMFKIEIYARGMVFWVIYTWMRCFSEESLFFVWLLPHLIHKVEEMRRASLVKNSKWGWKMSQSQVHPPFFSIVHHIVVFILDCWTHKGRCLCAKSQEPAVLQDIQWVCWMVESEIQSFHLNQEHLKWQGYT